ncbi:MAG: hypothetical protein CMK33_02985 [Porticoccaceae bacterium]|jgi:hypothetical protein|nr:hypothetical protein [Porticoccaceae bacterium]
MSETTSSAAKTSGGTAKTKPKASEIQRFFDALTANQKLMWESMEKARKRGIRINDTLAASFSKNQDDMVSLMRKLTLSPRDYKGNFTAAMDAVTASQAHAMELFKTMLSEYSQGREATKTGAMEFYENSKEIAAAGIEVAQSWTSANPFTESMKKTAAGMKKVADATREALA